MNAPLEELACLYVLDQLDASERTAFETKLAEDAELAVLVRKLESTLAARIGSLPQHEPPIDLLESIERRLPKSAPADARPQRSPAVIRPLWPAFARWGIAAVIAVSLATLAVQNLRRPSSPLIVLVQLDSNRSTVTELPLPQTAKDCDARFIQLASLAESYWKKNDMSPNAGRGASSASRGYALFDPSSREGFIAVEQLPSFNERKRFHLWTIDSDSGRVHEVGVLPVANTQGGLYSFSLPTSREAETGRLNFFITAEDVALSKSPTVAEPHGQVVLGDRARL